MAADITPFIKDAQRINEQTGIPASIILAQIIQESSGKYPGGLSGLAYNGKNLFGVKGVGSAGSVTYSSPEFIGGTMQQKMSAFKKFFSYGESIDEQAKFLSGQRYVKQFKDAKTVNDYAYGLQRAGYATDPNYASSLLKHIDTYNLHQYDTGDLTFKPVSTSSNSGSVEATEGENLTVVGSLANGIVRIVLILVLFIVGVVFFMKSFPATNDIVDTAAGAANPLKKVKALKGVTKLAK